MSENSTRARNRTVMLTPEVTGQMRSQFAPQIPAPVEADPGERGFEPPEVSEAYVPEEETQYGSAAHEETEWARPAAMAPASNGAESWSGNDSSDDDEEGEREEPKRLPAKRQAPSMKEQDDNVGYRNSSRSESEEIVWRTLTPLAGFLVSFDKNPLGDYVELRTGRIIVTSEREGSGNYLFIDDQSVSPMHAIMRVAADGPTQILDQLSEAGTKIIRVGTGNEEMLSGEKSTLSHGDVIVFGERKYHVCLLPGGRGKS